VTFWAKLRLWFKIACLSAVVLYVLIFVLKNTGEDRQVTLWVWFNKLPTAPLLFVLPITFLAGAISMLLTRTVWRTLRQLRDMKRRKMEREAAAIITRATKLRVRELQARSAPPPAEPLV
jgi:hypothetical protein